MHTDLEREKAKRVEWNRWTDGRKKWIESDVRMSKRNQSQLLHLRFLFQIRNCCDGTREREREWKTLSSKDGFEFELLLSLSIWNETQINGSVEIKDNWNFCILCLEMTKHSSIFVSNHTSEQSCYTIGRFFKVLGNKSLWLFGLFLKTQLFKVKTSICHVVTLSKTDKFETWTRS